MSLATALATLRDTSAVVDVAETVVFDKAGDAVLKKRWLSFQQKSRNHHDKLKRNDAHPQQHTAALT